MKLNQNVQPKKVTARVLQGLEAVKRAGTTNMFDWRVACIQAVALGYLEAQSGLKTYRDTCRRDFYWL